MNSGQLKVKKIKCVFVPPFPTSGFGDGVVENPVPTETQNNIMYIWNKIFLKFNSKSRLITKRRSELPNYFRS